MIDFILHDDFKDFIVSLNKAKVKYLLVGGYSVIFYGYGRSTMDMDIWVERSHVNYLKIVKAFKLFQMPVFDMTRENFLENDNLDVFSFGKKPVCIDLINKLKGVNFLDAWKSREEHLINGIPINLISKNHLIISKKAAGRFKDLDDIENLT